MFIISHQCNSKSVQYIHKFVIAVRTFWIWSKCAWVSIKVNLTYLFYIQFVIDKFCTICQNIKLRRNWFYFQFCQKRKTSVFLNTMKNIVNFYIYVRTAISLQDCDVSTNSDCYGLLETRVEINIGELPFIRPEKSILNGLL